MGRIVTFETPVHLSTLLANLTANLGRPKSLSLALPQKSPTVASHKNIRRIAACAGSGGSVLSKAESVVDRSTIDESYRDTGTVDMWITGELSHHEALAAIEKGKVVVCLGHGNSERGYLGEYMQGALLDSLSQERVEGDVRVVVSEADREPFMSLVRDGWMDGD